MGGDSDSHHRGSLWFSLSLLVEKVQEANTGFGVYGIYGVGGFIQIQDGIDQRLLGISGQNISGYESIY